MKSRIGVGVIGFGTVGTGVARVLLDNAALIRRRVGLPIELIRIADLDIVRDRGVALPPGLLTTNVGAVITDPAVDIVVELIGGCDVAKRVVLDAIAAGKHVVTANKALLALHGEEIYEAAARKGVEVGFEASVGGGIPVIRSLMEGLAGDSIRSIYGIINGTSNYILSRMTQEGHDFDTVLRDAQQAGYAEADPTFDVQGIDSAHKLAILVNLAYGTPVNVKEIYTEGITHVTSTDIAYAKEFGFVIKLLGIAKLVNGEIEARVHPTMLPATSPIARVDGVYNAIQLVGDAVGDLVLYGQGAGSMPTGQAVVSDIIAIGRNVLSGAAGRVPTASFRQDQRRPLRVKPMEEISSLYYLRFMVVDRPGVLAQIAGELGRCAISISSVLQQGRREGQTVPVVIKTHMASERDVRNALAEINRKPFVSEPATLIRVEGKDE
ncbi:homoserine dehydrogenase [Candidatus Nitrospira inopinata]|jgi:homoserine dehydrogenase|uniref:Homoserine dehydrogenase n=1 Tax=Candidatus Nitrospira inopinata TaxID=1715989 RepID=A0A0S4KMQ7_9BACT|nr:homoserine dehydrogenase [Candidatus Nitrospira inopinata]CUQ65745.1 Homoserine dehydrogenase [Candidatus Nitrospira inopinata]